MKATMVSLDGRETIADLEIDELLPRERLIKGGRRGLIFVAIALAWIPVPALHFIMVPGFLVAGVVAFVSALRETSEIRSCRGTCPLCQESIEFSSQKVQAVIKEVCPHCRHVLRLILQK